MAYGARLESVLGASPRGFESPILRHRSGTVRFRIFLCLIYSHFPDPRHSPGPHYSPDPRPLPAHLVQAPALRPARLFIDDAAPRTAHRPAHYRAAPCAVGNKKSRHALHDGN